MPNRILKESICSSADIDCLTAFEETVFYRLIVNCDDYGRFDARPEYLKSKLFATKQGITVKNIKDAILKLATVGLVWCYSVDDKPFLLLPKWELHQQIRAKKSKFPAPVDDNVQKIPSDINSYHLISDDSICRRNTIQYESNSKSESNIVHRAVTADCSSAVIALLLNDKSEYPISKNQIDNWGTLYPNVNILQELRKMKGWLEANPQKRKTKNGILRFVTNWLCKTQDRGGSSIDFNKKQHFYTPSEEVGEANVKQYGKYL